MKKYADDLTCGLMSASGEDVSSIKIGAPGIAPGNEAFIVPSSVGFVARAFPGASFGTKEYAAENVLGHLLSTGFLWQQVRMQGGAYGAHGASFGPDQVFVFSSYRDPHITRTVKAFQQALEFAQSGSLGTEELERALIGVVGDAETPQRPPDRGYGQFKRTLFGIDDALRARQRENLLGLGVQDLAGHARELLGKFSAGKTAVLAGEEAVSKAETEDAGLKFSKQKLPV